ncbi:F-box protein [Apostasia shenzhenica]|uniref:F-box protein n=1 Tax=Apostasia shenzhenica TaxID=1088818 RepID=A0A2I0BDN0_9ASPA|nr:F-box protein [Apostasia shenzhenica]
MAALEEALRVRHYHRLPSAEEFSADIEPSNVPTVFYGAVNDWKAITRWNPSTGGLDYLQEKVGTAVVEAMLSKYAPVFYGDLGSHERVPLPFSTFISSCKSYLKEIDNCNRQKDTELKVATVEESTSSSEEAHQTYLAQVPILNAENKGASPLEILSDDLEVPIFLGSKALASVNLWMNRDQSRSSTHYDPHHNLLCTVVGCKQVILWPPSACPLLYPMPIFGQASNHSTVDIVNPDFSVHGRAKNAKEYSQKIILHSGDALFIPEGWFHQVDSDDLSMAVNFWWKSQVMSGMLEHMDAYFLRRILNRLVDKEMNNMLARIKGSLNGEERYPKIDASEGCSLMDSQSERKDAMENSKKFPLTSDQLEPIALNTLYQLVSLVHENLSTSRHVKPSGSASAVSDDKEEDECESIRIGCSSLLLDDPVSRILWAVEPFVLQKVLLHMVNHFPRTLEGLITCMLSPAAAEILTRKFDEMDDKASKEQQSEFYRQFYKVFDDPYAAMDVILRGKEAFARQAFCNVLDEYLGVCVDETSVRTGLLRSDKKVSRRA